MKYRMLGKTGLKVSELGYGCWGIGGGVLHPRWKDMWKANDSDSRKALRKAAELGVNFFDTAFVYGDGHSERLLGELAKDYPDIIVATKIPPKNMEWPARVDIDIEGVFPKDHIIKFALQSYKNLGNRTINLLQLHVWTDKWVNSTEWQDAFEQLKEEGVVDYFGVSVNDHSPETAIRLAKSGRVDTLQLIYNIFDQSPEDQLFPIAKKENLGVIARVPFDEGSLTGKFTYDTKFNDWRRFYFNGNRLKETVDRVEKMRFLENRGRTLPQAALQFVIANDAVSTVIPGMRKEEHVIENLKAVESSLSRSKLKELRKHRWQRNFYKDAI